MGVGEKIKKLEAAVRALHAHIDWCHDDLIKKLGGEDPKTTTYKRGDGDEQATKTKLSPETEKTENSKEGMEGKS